MKHIGRFLLCAALSYALFSVQLGDTTSWYTILSSLNLVLHELGHVLTVPFGKTVHILGGTAFQWGCPLALVLVCLYNHEKLGAATMLFWLGQSMHDEVPYIADATSLKIDLFGGSIHDWNYLLFKWGVLHHDAAIAKAVEYIGVGLMCVAVIACWALFVHGMKRNPVAF